MAVAEGSLALIERLRLTDHEPQALEANYRAVQPPSTTTVCHVSPGLTDEPQDRPDEVVHASLIGKWRVAAMSGSARRRTSHR
jgi:hypothetical protein